MRLPDQQAAAPWGAPQAQRRRNYASGSLVATLAVVILLTLVPLDWWGFHVFVAGVLVVAYIWARIPWRRALKRLLLVEPMVLGAVLLALVGPARGHHGGLWGGAEILVRTTLAILALLWLTESTPFEDILMVLRRWRVPSLLLTILALLQRYRFVLVEESGRLRRARASRTFGTRRRHVWAALAGVIGVLFVRSVDRAERIYAAMCARGWR